MTSRFYSPDVLRYQITDLIWLRYHAHLRPLEGKYLIAPFLIRFGSISGSFGLAMGISAQLRTSSQNTNHRATELALDQPPKHVSLLLPLEIVNGNL